MKFDLTQPCSACPFRKDCLPGWLGEEKATGLVSDVILGDNSFACHQTVNYEWQGGEYRNKGNEQFCAGAATLESKVNKAGNLALRFGRLAMGFRYEQLKNTELVFDTVEDFVKHHK